MENKMPLLWKFNCRGLWKIVYHLHLGEGIREKAEINTKTEIIINLMDSMKISAEESMKLIKIKPEEYEAYRSRVEDMVLRSK